MGYPEDLLEHANDLCQLNPGAVPRQADLRRAVSAAYYALFHLLTMEAANNWTHESQRYRFARFFDHGPMSKRCDEVKKRLKERPGNKPNDPETGAYAKLQTVADAFIDLQDKRESADYDNSRQWTQSEALEAVVLSKTAIATWTEIRGTEIAQDFLFDLIGSRGGSCLAGTR
jgi:uncharacterized protein (UPF0332 family)